MEKVEPRWKKAAEANAFFRTHLICGEEIYGEYLLAHIRDPETGLILSLSSNGWAPEPGPPPRLGKRSKYFQNCSGIDSDYVIDPWDDYEPGPEGTCIRGKFRPVFFWINDFDRWFGERSAISNVRAGLMGPAQWKA